MATALELAGERIALHGLSPSQARSLQLRYGALCGGEPEDGDFAIALHTDVFPDRDTRGWEYAIDLEWRPDGFALEGWRVRATFERESGDVWTSVVDEESFWGVLENVLRPWLASRLLTRGGLLVHSASVDGMLFPGRSGAGKSTIAKLGLRAGRAVLSDDLNAVRGSTIAPLPFTGDLTEGERAHDAASLRAIIGLEHGDTESIRDLSEAEAAALLVRCAPYVNRDPYRAAMLLDRAAALATSARRGVLTFRREGQVWPILDAWHDQR